MKSFIICIVLVVLSGSLIGQAKILVGKELKIVHPEYSDGTWKLMHKNKVHCSVEADSITDSQYNFFAYSLDGKWGVIDKNCEPVYTNVYHHLEELDAGQYIVSKGEKYGLISLDGLLLLPFKFDNIDSYSSSKSLVKIHDEWQYIDSLGHMIDAERLYFLNPTFDPLFDICDKKVSEEDDEKCSTEALLQFVYKKLRYPKQARDNGTQGMVVVVMSISPEGKVTDLGILEDIGDGCGQAALDVFRDMPDWYPAEVDGKPVWTYYTMPIRFRLE